ncbi:TPA: methylthioribulose 1-phosphate dehydratase, partial [Pseudomonas aeruginosa]
MNDNREQLTQQIIDAGRFLYGRGWSPATSSNYSARLDEQRAL